MGVGCQASVCVKTVNPTVLSMVGKVVFVGLLLAGLLPARLVAGQGGPAAAAAALPPAARQAYYQTAFEQRAAQLYATLGLGREGLWPWRCFGKA